jgi:hypothetical protein
MTTRELLGTTLAGCGIAAGLLVPIIGVLLSGTAAVVGGPGTPRRVAWVGLAVSVVSGTLWWKLRGPYY